MFLLLPQACHSHSRKRVAAHWLLPCQHQRCQLQRPPLPQHWKRVSGALRLSSADSACPPLPCPAAGRQLAGRQAGGEQLQLQPAEPTGQHRCQPPATIPSNRTRSQMSSSHSSSRSSSNRCSSCWRKQGGRARTFKPAVAAGRRQQQYTRALVRQLASPQAAPDAAGEGVAAEERAEVAPAVFDDAWGGGALLGGVGR